MPTPSRTNPAFTDGMLKNKQTYEIIAPETIGYFRGEGDVGVVMGKHSGRHALKSKLKQLGFPLEETSSTRCLTVQARRGAEDGRRGDDEIIALVTSGAGQGDDTAITWKLDEVQVVCGTMGLPTATVKMTGPDAVTRINSAGRHRTRRRRVQGDRRFVPRQGGPGRVQQNAVVRIEFWRNLVSIRARVIRQCRL